MCSVDSIQCRDACVPVTVVTALGMVSLHSVLFSSCFCGTATGSVGGLAAGQPGEPGTRLPSGERGPRGRL